MFFRNAFKNTQLLRMFSPRVTTRRYFASSSFESSNVWAKMSENEKMNCALSESIPQSAKMAFYKGKALLMLEDYNAAIHAFELAKKIDPNYTSPSNEAVANIYHKIGKKEDAYTLICQALTALKTLKDKPEQLSTLDQEIGEKYTAFTRI